MEEHTYCQSQLPQQHQQAVAAVTNPSGNAASVAAAATAAATLKALEYQVVFCLATLDQSLTREYYHALEVVPEIVTAETKFIDFLRTEDYSAPAAAARIARFWKLRKKVFGDRWLLRLNQTGTGCLSMEDVEMLRTGYYTVYESEQLGLVWLLDFSRMPQGHGMFHAGVTFYTCAVTACERGQTQGVTALILASRRRQSAPIVNNTAVEEMLGAMPMKYRQIYVAHAFDPDRQPVVEFQAFALQRQAQANVRNVESHEVTANSQADLLRQLQVLGFDRTCLHAELGGDKDYNAFSNWMRMRISLEDIMSSTPIGRNARQISSSSMLQQQQQRNNFANNHALASTTTPTVSSKNNSHQDNGSSSSATLQRLPGESQADFNRRRNKQYVKRYYHRTKLTLLSFEGEHDMLRKCNSALRKQNRKLQELLRKARKVLANHGVLLEEDNQKKVAARNGDSLTWNPAHFVYSNGQSNQQSASAVVGNNFNLPSSQSPTFLSNAHFNDTKPAALP